MVTWADLFTLVSVITDIVTLVIVITNNKK